MEARIFYFIPFVLLEIALVSFLIFIFVKLLILVFRALHKYLNSNPPRQEEEVPRRSLGEVLKEHRLRCSMTQEFVAETMGVSRQAVCDNLARTEALLRKMETSVGCVSRSLERRKAVQELLDIAKKLSDPAMAEKIIAACKNLEE